MKTNGEEDGVLGDVDLELSLEVMVSGESQHVATRAGITYVVQSDLEQVRCWGRYSF